METQPSVNFVRPSLAPSLPKGFGELRDVRLQGQGGAGDGLIIEALDDGARVCRNLVTSCQEDNILDDTVVENAYSTWKTLSVCAAFGSRCDNMSWAFRGASSGGEDPSERS